MRIVNDLILSINSSNIDALINKGKNFSKHHLGKSYVEEKKFNEAFDYLDKVLIKNPNHVDAIFYKGKKSYSY